MVDIALQGASKGIHYEGYTKAFRECIFEEGDVHGKNERYEFRCDSDLECCGRVCCVPQEATIPLWLMLILIFLALLLLLAILGTLAYLCAKRRKPKPKKALDVYSSKAGYAPLGTATDKSGLVKEQDNYSTPDHLYGGYGNQSYNSGSRGYARDMHGAGGYGGNGIDGNAAREIAIRDTRREFGRGGAGQFGGDRGYGRRPSDMSDNASQMRHGIHETVEESFKQEITYERAASTDSQELL